MIFEPRIFLWALAFAGTLYYGSYSERLLSFSGYLSIVFPLLIVSALAGHKLLRRAVRIFVPILIAFVVPLLLSLIDSTINIILFVIIGSSLYYAAFLSLYRLKSAPEDQTAQALLHGTLMASALFFFAGITGLYINFTLPLSLTMLLVMVVISLITFVSFLTVSQEDKHKNFLYSFLVGFLMGELFFVASFWPFGYLTTGSVLTSMYYLFWVIALDSFQDTLSLRRAVERISLVFILVLLVLITSPWKVVL